MSMPHTLRDHRPPRSPGLRESQRPLPAADPGGAWDNPHVDYVEQVFLNEPYRPGSFNFIRSVTAVHHMNFSAALTRMRELTRPGGCVAGVGLALDTSPVAARDPLPG
jgi:hypothetical protein